MIQGTLVEEPMNVFAFEQVPSLGKKTSKTLAIYAEESGVHDFPQPRNETVLPHPVLRLSVHGLPELPG